MSTTAADVMRLAEVRRAAKAGTAKELRLATGLTQAEVAAVCGVTPDAVSRWESGTRTPRGRPALRYALLLEDLRELA